MVSRVTVCVVKLCQCHSSSTSGTCQVLEKLEVGEIDGDDGGVGTEFVIPSCRGYVLFSNSLPLHVGKSQFKTNMLLSYT